jgi:ketosteroid isomerase-like protein
VDAIAGGDIDRQLQFVHTNVVVTWQNNVVARGHQGLRDFYAKIGKDAFKGYKVPPTPDELTIIYGGDTGISFGESVGAYNLFGRPFEFKNRWTATLVKENGRWQLAGYHVSLDALNNPLINAAKKSLFVAGGLAGAIGLVLGIFIGRSTNRALAQRPGST